MDEKRKAISADDRLRVLGLFAMAKEHSTKADEFVDAMERMLGIDSGSHLADAAYRRGPFSIAEFDMAFAMMLEREGIVVVAEKED